ncbi:MAG: hypothetical protein WC758_03980 [Candidatus Woesearchaeota archaeon]|jgi:hypothetical protein
MKKKNTKVTKIIDNKSREDVFTIKELALINSLNSPFKIQEFINTLIYNEGKRISVVDVMRLKKGDCLEAACFAYFVLQKHKIESFLMDLSASRDEDHVICVFKINGLCGAIAQSKFLGLRYRQPVYKDFRELAMSYFDNYFSFQGYFSLRSYSIMPMTIKNDWVFDFREIVKIENKFSDLEHINLFPKNMVLAITPASLEKFKREIIILPKYASIHKRYK